MTGLAVDLGGTKLLVALVDEHRVLDRIEVPTNRDAGPDAWLAQIADMAAPWSGEYNRIGVTVTGLVQDGNWSALNRATLDIPPQYPLANRASEALGVRPTLRNDAQAAAWGEYLFGAGARKDIVFLTISTGVGGGIVAGGQLLSGQSGMAGHFGQTVLTNGSATRIEDVVAGRWMAKAAQAAGHEVDARGVFAAAGTSWADAILDDSASRIARLCQDLQFVLDPPLFVIGGGIGLAPGYIERIEAHLDVPRRPILARAALGADAGIIGIAALACE